MNIIHMTGDFEQWMGSLSDIRLKALVMRRIAQAAAGNFGDCKALGGGMAEMRIHYGAGWRLYYTQEGRSVYLLLHAGNKASQRKDIQKALSLWQLIQGERP